MLKNYETFIYMLLLTICSKCAEDHLCEISRSSDKKWRPQLNLKFSKIWKKMFKIKISQTACILQKKKLHEVCWFLCSSEAKIKALPSQHTTGWPTFCNCKKQRHLVIIIILLSFFQRNFLSNGSTDLPEIFRVNVLLDRLESFFSIFRYHPSFKSYCPFYAFLRTFLWHHLLRNHFSYRALA